VNVDPQADDVPPQLSAKFITSVPLLHDPKTGLAEHGPVLAAPPPSLFAHADNAKIINP
jgi:hypothetical protein